jgi:hypothetical protein
LKAEVVRSTRDLEFLNQQISTLVSAINANLFFVVDEYLTFIWNLFIAKGGATAMDEKLLTFMVTYSHSICNDRNARIIQLELDRLISSRGSLLPTIELPLIHPLCPENIRTQIRNLGISGSSFADSDDNADTLFDYTKYCRDFDTRFNWNRIYYRRSAPEKSSIVLDIGTGMGFLSHIFTHNGHQVDTFDMVGCAQVFDDSCRILGVDKQAFSVEKYTPLLNLGRKYELVVSTLICFNHHRQPGLWMRDEWMYFLKDLYDNVLKSKGRVILDFNREAEGDMFLGHSQIHELFDPFLMNNTTNTYELKKDDIRVLLSE